jgi:acyl carrier protein
MCSRLFNAERVLENGENQMDIKKALRDFIVENFLPFAGVDSFEDDDSFMENGIIDSTGVLELLEFIEEQFNITVEDEEVIPDNLDSLNKMTSFIDGKISNAGA